MQATLVASTLRHAASLGASNLNWHALNQQDYSNLQAILGDSDSPQQTSCEGNAWIEDSVRTSQLKKRRPPLGWFSALPPARSSRNGSAQEEGEEDVTGSGNRFELSEWQGDWINPYDATTCTCRCERDVTRIPRKKIAPERSTLPMSLLRVACQRKDNSSRRENVVVIHLPKILGEGTLHVVYRGDVVHSVRRVPINVAVSMLIPKDKGKAKSEACVRGGKSSLYDCAHGKQFMEHIALLDHLSGHPGVLSLFGAGYCSQCQDTLETIRPRDIGAVDLPTGVMLLPLGRQQSWKDVLEDIYGSESQQKLALDFVDNALSLFKYLTEDRMMLLGDMDAYTVVQKQGAAYQECYMRKHLLFLYKIGSCLLASHFC